MQEWKEPWALFIIISQWQIKNYLVLYLTNLWSRHPSQWPRTLPCTFQRAGKWANYHCTHLRDQEQIAHYRNARYDGLDWPWLGTQGAHAHHGTNGESSPSKGLHDHSPQAGQTQSDTVMGWTEVDRTHTRGGIMFS